MRMLKTLISLLAQFIIITENKTIKGKKTRISMFYQNRKQISYDIILFE